MKKALSLLLLAMLAVAFSGMASAQEELSL